MLGRRRRRRANIDPALAQCIVFAGIMIPDIIIITTSWRARAGADYATITKNKAHFYK